MTVSILQALLMKNKNYRYQRIDSLQAVYRITVSASVSDQLGNRLRSREKTIRRKSYNRRPFLFYPRLEVARTGLVPAHTEESVGFAPVAALFPAFSSIPLFDPAECRTVLAFQTAALRPTDDPLAYEIPPGFAQALLLHFLKTAQSILVLSNHQIRVIGSDIAQSARAKFGSQDVILLHKLFQDKI
jgi:hypothetical protein